jgi:hypothetical protein
MFEYRFVTSCAALTLAFITGCDDSAPIFEEVNSARASDAFTAGAGNENSRARGPAPVVTDAGAAVISLPPDVSIDPAGVVFCGNEACQCNNGIDDDGDGTADGLDVECTGGIDDDESSFGTGIPGDNRDPKWQDCFFDGNSGAGDDRCRYPTECLTGDLSLDHDACAVTEACRDNCQPRTPNGCDCFGCCAVELPGKSVVNVTLSDSCSAEKVGDAEACPPCTPNPECGYNPPPNDPDPNAPPVDAGAPPADPEPPTDACGGRPTCVDEFDACPVGDFCSLGCCLVVIR